MVIDFKEHRTWKKLSRMVQRTPSKSYLTNVPCIRERMRGKGRSFLLLLSSIPLNSTRSPSIFFQVYFTYSSKREKCDLLGKVVKDCSGIVRGFYKSCTQMGGWAMWQNIETCWIFARLGIMLSAKKKVLYCCENPIVGYSQENIAKPA